MTEPGEPGEPGAPGERGDERAGGVGGAGGAGGLGDPTGAGGEGGHGGAGGAGGTTSDESSRLRRWWCWFDEHGWVTAIALVVLLVVPGFFRVERSNETAKQAAEQVAHEEAVRADEQCITAWTVREDIRNAIERSTLAGGEAIIAVADAPPEQIAAYREHLTAQAQMATREIPDPDCDEAAARKRLDRPARDAGGVVTPGNTPTSTP
jgi:hypothetical protein